MWTRPLLLMLLATLPPGTQHADTLTERAMSALRACAQYTIFDDVTVQVIDGTARVSGQVTSNDKRRAITTHIARVPGIRSIADDLEVLPDDATDAALRVRIAQAIYGHATFWEYAASPSPPIRIIVSGARVRLTGVVASNVERALAQSLASVKGVLGVRNDLTSR